MLKRTLNSDFIHRKISRALTFENLIRGGTNTWWQPNFLKLATATLLQHKGRHTRPTQGQLGVETETGEGVGAEEGDDRSTRPYNFDHRRPWTDDEMGVCVCVCVCVCV